MPHERLTIRHDSGTGAEPYVQGTLLAVRRVMQVVGLVRGLDRLLFEASLQQRLASLPALPRGGFEDLPTLVRFNGTTPWTLKSVPALEQRFIAAFGRRLPISAFGQTKVHDQLGLDHRIAIDVAVSPDSAEGQWLMKDLRKAGIPFIGVRGVVPGASTGAHVHIGPESPRLIAR